MTAALICRALDRERQEGASLDELLVSAVGKLHASNSRFHWTGIYELFEDGMLRLGPFIGAPTDHVFIGVGQGVCGTAVARVLAGAEVAHHEMGLSVDEKMRSVYLSAMPILTMTGEIAEIMVMLQDLSNLKLLRR